MTKTPDWLVETQNKSWEPEILISGITLTFLFILSTYIFNFYGMLIQDYGLRFIIGKKLYDVSIIVLTGLKVGLIFHLILRGIWTGFVGLSYVFPEGVNKQNMQKSKKHIDYHKPETYVIKLERICSLLFSFIFSSIIFVSSFFLTLVPMALLYISGLDITYIRALILYFVLPLFVIIVIVVVILSTSRKASKFEDKMENSIFSNILTTYFTNIGLKKSLCIFVLYFLFIGLLSRPDMTKFDFDNERSETVTSQAGVPQLDEEHYQNFRDNNLRISKAAIDQFRIHGNAIDLFISFYKEDLYTLKNLQENPAPLNESGIRPECSEVRLETLYQIYVDDKQASDLRWYIIENSDTNQKGIMTTIPCDTLSRGYHELRINKIFWINKKKDAELIKNWDIIPFELQNQ